MPRVPEPRKAHLPKLVPDVVVHNGVALRSRRPILLHYLRDHPARCEDVMRLVPEAVHGIHVRARVHHGALLIEGVQVAGLDDPLADMVLWHALFPGLRAPLIAWWCNGLLLLDGIRPDDGSILDGRSEEQRTWAGMDHGRLFLERGRIMVPAPSARPRTDDPFTWPLWQRLLLSPLLVLFVPAAVVMVYREGMRQRRLAVPWWFGLLLPMLFLAVSIKWLAPGTFDRHLEHIFLRMGAEVDRRQAVNELLDDALHRDVDRSLRD